MNIVEKNICLSKSKLFKKISGAINVTKREAMDKSTDFYRFLIFVTTKRGRMNLFKRFKILWT